MKTVTRRGIAQLCALLAGVLATGCLSPTLPPFPPPAEPQTMTFVAPGQLRLQGVLTHQRATVFALNPETGDIAGKLIRDGSYSFVVPAQPSQELELFYQVGKDVSDSTFFRAPAYDGPVVPVPSATSSTATDSSPPGDMSSGSDDVSSGSTADDTTSAQDGSVEPDASHVQDASGAEDATVDDLN